MSGVLVVEGAWTASLPPDTVLPGLSFLRDATEARCRLVHRPVASPAELHRALADWTEPRWDRFPTLYLGFHGEPGLVYLDHTRTCSVDLEWISRRLAGRCQRRLIHVGACATLAVPRSRLVTFLEHTGAVAVTGYARPIDWDPSLMFELLLLWHLNQANYRSPVSVLRALENLRRSVPGLVQQLAFRALVRP
jgi:hypothetical protein